MKISLAPISSPLLILVVGILMTTTGGCGESIPELPPEEIRNQVLTLLVLRKHAGLRFDHLFFDDVDPVLYDPTDRFLYLALRPEDCARERRGEVVGRYLEEGTVPRWNRQNDSVLWLGPYRGRLSERVGCVCRVYVDKVEVDPEQRIALPVASDSIVLSFREVAEISANLHNYGGLIRLTNGGATYLNHGVLTSKPGDPVITQLVDIIFAETDPDDLTREERITRVVNFINREFTAGADEVEYEDGGIRRSLEAVMLRNIGPGNKAILVASVFEEIDEEYLLHYSQGRVTPMVPREEIEIRDDRPFVWDDEVWIPLPMDGTDLELGRYPPRRYHLEWVDFIQHPSWEPSVMNPSTGETF